MKLSLAEIDATDIDDIFNMRGDIEEMLEDVIREWRDARDAIFTHGLAATLDMWARLGHAEHRMMRFARKL